MSKKTGKEIKGKLLENLLPSELIGALTAKWGKSLEKTSYKRMKNHLKQGHSNVGIKAINFSYKFTLKPYIKSTPIGRLLFVGDFSPYAMKAVVVTSMLANEYTKIDKMTLKKLREKHLQKVDEPHNNLEYYIPPMVRKLSIESYLERLKGYSSHFEPDLFIELIKEDL